VDDARRALGPDFLAAYIVGSALAQGFEARHSDIDVLLLARRLTLEALDRLAAAPLRRGAFRIGPILHTSDQLEHARDVFAVEFSEIRQRHLLIAGTDVVRDLAIPHDALRLQCERALRLRQARLVRAFVRHHRSPETLLRCLVDFSVAFVPLGRSLLRLREEIVPASGAQVIERVADVFGLEPGAFLFPYAVRYGAPRLTGAVVRQRMLAYLGELARLIATTDRLVVVDTP
jgi:hypothetical protein